MDVDNMKTFKMGHHKSKLYSKVPSCRSIQELKAALASPGVIFNVNAQVNMEEYENVTPLWVAVKYGELEIVKLFLSLRADPNIACGSLLMTPLHLASYNHDEQVVMALLKAGANPNVLDKWNYTPLMYVVIHHEPFLTSKLVHAFLCSVADVNYGATLNEKGDREIADCNTDLVELCSSYDGATVSYVRVPMGPTSGTALHLATQNPHLSDDVMEMFFSFGAVADKRNLYGQTALMVAMMDLYYDYHKNVKSHTDLLLRHGGNVNVRDKRGWSAFHYAAQRGSISCMQRLLEEGADCDATSAKGETALWLLLGLGWQEAARFLLVNGCRINQTLISKTILDINPNNDVCAYGPILPVEFAICNRYYGISTLLVQLGCKIDATTWLGERLDHPQIKHLEFIDFVAKQTAQRNNVGSLLQCSRTTIRRTMQCAISVKVEQLLLPQVLKDFICFRED